MRNQARNRRINGTALESIMRDVMQGMQEFTFDACCGCDAAGLEILGVEDAGDAALSTARVFAFPSVRD